MVLDDLAAVIAGILDVKITDGYGVITPAPQFTGDWPVLLSIGQMAFWFRMSRSEMTRYTMSIANSTARNAQTRQKNAFITTWL
jgi:hypothetical protein